MSAICFKGVILKSQTLILLRVNEVCGPAFSRFTCHPRNPQPLLQASYILSGYGQNYPTSSLHRWLDIRTLPAPRSLPFKKKMLICHLRSVTALMIGCCGSEGAGSYHRVTSRAHWASMNSKCYPGISTGEKAFPSTGDELAAPRL